MTRLTAAAAATTSGDELPKEISVPIRRLVLAALALVLVAPAALAHHGIIFVSDHQVRVTGTVVHAMTGNPHFEIQVQDGDTRWAIDLANPYRIKKAGLSWNGSEMPVGTTVAVEGFPAADPSMKTIQARTIWIDDEIHRLFDEDEPHY